MGKAMLITGGLGFIGQHLASKLIDEGFKVYVVDNDPRGWYFNNTLGEKSLDIEWINRDLTHHKFPISDDVVGIYHLAGAVGTKRLVSQGAQMLGDNVDMMANLIRSVKMTRRPIKIVFASTNEVYGLNPETPLPYREDAPITLPIEITDRWAYAAAKLVGEWMLQTSGLDYTIARLCNVYGEGMKHEYVIKSFIKRMIDNPGEMIVGNSDDTRPFTYVGDTVRGLMSLMSSHNSFGQIYNLGADDEVAIWALAEHIAILGNFDVTFNLPGHSSTRERRWADVSKIKDHTGWEADTPLSSGLIKTIDWYKENYV